MILPIGNPNEKPCDSGNYHQYTHDDQHHLSSSLRDALHVASIMIPTNAPAIIAGISHHADIIFVPPLVR